MDIEDKKERTKEKLIKGIGKRIRVKRQAIKRYLINKTGQLWNKRDREALIGEGMKNEP